MDIKDESLEREAAEIFAEHGHRPEFVGFTKVLAVIDDAVKDIQNRLGCSHEYALIRLDAGVRSYCMITAQGRLGDQMPLNRELMKLIDERAAKEAEAIVAKAKEKSNG